MSMNQGPRVIRSSTAPKPNSATVGSNGPTARPRPALPPPLPGGPPPEPLPVDEDLDPEEADRRFKRRVIWTTLAILLLILLLLLLLWLLLAGPGWGNGQGTGYGNGTGSGSGDGTGSGSGSGDGAGQGDGSGDDTGSGSGAGQGDQTGDGKASGKATTKSSQGRPSSKPRRPAPPPKPIVQGLNLLPAEPVVEDSPEPVAAQGPSEFSSGGSGGGGGGGGAEFFGARAKGRRFVYLVDCSGSMLGPPHQRACDELKRSLNNLQSYQQFCVIFFGVKPYFFPGKKSDTPELMSASKANIEQVMTWAYATDKSDGFEDFKVMHLALTLKPDSIFVLSDGITTYDTSQVRSLNQRKVAIHTISILTEAGRTLMETIATENFGTWRYVH